MEIDHNCGTVNSLHFNKYWYGLCLFPSLFRLSV